MDGILDSLSLEVRPLLWAVEEVAIYGLEVDETARAERIATLTDALERFEALLDADGPDALGGAFTIADAGLAGRLLHLPRLPLDPHTAPRIRRTVGAATARPAFAAARR